MIWLALTLWFGGSSVAGLTVYTLFKRERQFSQIMSSNRNLNRSRYYRLMALACLEILCTIPLSAFLLHNFSTNHLEKWISWSVTHHDYTTIVQVPNSVWQATSISRFSVECRWFYILCSYTFFAFFGFADEARQHYRLAYKSLVTRAGFSTSSLKLDGSSSHGYVVHFVWS